MISKMSQSVWARLSIHAKSHCRATSSKTPCKGLTKCIGGILVPGPSVKSIGTNGLTAHLIQMPLPGCLSVFVSVCVSSLIVPVVPPSRNVQLHKESHDECHLSPGDKFLR